jgi:hypothetical protein
VRSWPVVLALLSVASTLPPMPKFYNAPKGTTQGAGALALIAKPKLAVTIVAPGREWVVAWRYGNVQSNLYYWDLMTSTNLRTWTLLRSNVTEGVTVTNNLAEKCRFYRLRGRVVQ